MSEEAKRAAAAPELTEKNPYRSGKCWWAWEQGFARGCALARRTMPEPRNPDMGEVAMTAEQWREKSEIKAADAFRQTLLDRADGWSGGAPLWHGWAIMDAFRAGSRWATRTEDISREAEARAIIQALAAPSPAPADLQERIVTLEGELEHQRSLRWEAAQKVERLREALEAAQPRAPEQAVEEVERGQALIDKWHIKAEELKAEVERLREGRAPAVGEDLDVNEIIEQLEYLARQSGARLTSLFTDAAAVLRNLRASVERLREALRIIAGEKQCIDNLMSNADIARAALAASPEPKLVECDQCGGTGFDTPGTGYGNVCSKCGGQRELPAEPGARRRPRRDTMQDDVSDAD